MKATGIVRKMDQLGRVVIPIELRRTMGIDVRDGIEVFVDEDQIILRKYTPACFFCDSASDLYEYNGKMICGDCIQRLKEALGK